MNLSIVNCRVPETLPGRGSRSRPRALLSLLTFTACALSALSPLWQTPAQPNDLHFEQLNLDRGLLSNEVTRILQDSRGFMLFATTSGLNRYDGYTFTPYKTDLLDTASLSGPWINLLSEDPHGDLWMTTGGLNRLDRVTGKVSRYLTDRHITSLCVDSSLHAEEDGMWFTTLGGGVYRYQRSSGRFTEYRHSANDPNSISSDSAFCTSVDAAGRVWIGTARGINSLDRTRRQVTHYAHGPSGSVYTVEEDQDEPSRYLWIGASDGLYLYDMVKDSMARYRNDLGTPHRTEDNDVRIVYRDRASRLWVGTIGGIAGFDRSSRRFTSYQADVGTSSWGYVNKAWSICEDRTGTMWMVCPWGPLRKYDEVKKAWTRVQIASDHEITFHDVYEDRAGTVWFGTVNDGLLKLDRARKPFSVYTKIPGDKSSLSSSTVTGICEDASGVLWVGTLGGLNRLDAATGTFTHYLHDDRKLQSLSHNQISSIIEDRKGTLWIGTQGGGLDQFDRANGRFTHHRYRPGDSLSLANNGVDVLWEGRDGMLWIGTDDGSASEYSPVSGIFRRHFPDYQHSVRLVAGVNAGLEDHTGRIWMAVPPAGLMSYDRMTQKWTQIVSNLRPKQDAATVVVPGTLSLCEDHRGILWTGTDQGLFKLEERTGTFVRYSVKDGLADNFVDAILEDGKGRLWLCTLNGITRFDPVNGTIRNYDAGDGLTMGPCKLPTGHKNRNGEMFFGGGNGFVRFHPDSIYDNPFVPPIVITAFKKFDVPVALDTAASEKHSLELSYKENVFSFEFAALNYVSPKRNQYAYKLEGFDKDWTYCGTRRYATYTNLDGGDYVFKVKGSNNDGVWNEQGASIAITIVPPFWVTWWFRTLALLALFGAVGGTIRYIEIRKMKRRIELLQQEQALERERIRISRDMHDEVGASLTEISILSELARKEMGDASNLAGSHIGKIADRSREVVDSISEIIWSINPKNDHLDDLIAYLRHHATSFLKPTAVGCRFVAPESVPAFSLSPEVRRHIFLVVKEALANVAKHSGATEATVTCLFGEGKMEVSVEDNGKGFLLEQVPLFGNGVVNMRKRIESIGGTFVIESQQGRGTKICISIPVASPSA